MPDWSVRPWKRLIVLQPMVRLEDGIQPFYLCFSGNHTGGSDYDLDTKASGLAGLTKAEKLKLIFQALDKKNKEFKRKTGTF